MVGVTGQALRKVGRDRLAHFMADIPDYHGTPIPVAALAKRAQAKMLVFSHIVPALPLDYLESYYLEGVPSAYDGPVVLGKDGMLFSLSANKDSIEQTNLL